MTSIFLKFSGSGQFGLCAQKARERAACSSEEEDPTQHFAILFTAWDAMALARITPTLSMHQLQPFNFTLKAVLSQSRFHYGGTHSFFKLAEPHVLNSKASIQAIAHDSSKQDKKQSRRPGLSKHRYHFFKRTGQSASGTKAATLVNTVISLSNVKEEIYAALDEWVAFEVEFPIIAVGKALKRLKEREQWLRIIQVSKWMLSKGQGKTFGTYSLMLKAYEMDSRLEDCEVLWEKLLIHYARSVPKSMFSLMIHIYKRQHMPGKLVEVFEQMESYKMRPDIDSLTSVKDAYGQLGQPGKQQFLMAKYPPAWTYLKFNGKSIKVRPRPEINESAAESEEGFEGDMYEEIS